jgi:3-hydroxybutyryl-CoA dehydrogenase
MEIHKVGVIGAGQMGNGIAHVCALAGYDVLLHDVKKEKVDAAFEIISGNLSRQVARGKISDAEKDKAMKRIQPAFSLDDFAQVDFAIEAATEDEKVKRQIFQSLCPKLSKNAMIASNTSSISITRLASVTDRPERFIGVHFMNPVPLMQLVELIRGIATEEETFLTVQALVKRLGKTSANSEDFPAFIVNRILLPMINEAVYTLYEGVGTVEGIDTAMRLGANHPMGPLQLADFIGWIRACPSCRFSMKASPTPSIAPARCS